MGLCRFFCRLRSGSDCLGMKPEPLKRYVWKRTPDPSSRREMSRLSPEEEAAVRLALNVLRTQHGGEWKAVAAALRSNKRTITKLMCFERRITATYALRIARLLREPLASVQTGAFMANHQCPSCGAVTLNGRAVSPKRKSLR